MKLGCCGWSYFKVNEFLRDFRGMDPEEKDWKDIYDHKIQAYADFFDLVEVNKTFYDLPQVKTADKWLRLAREVNPDFEFMVKAPKIITHKERFASSRPLKKFEETKRIAEALDSEIILLQSPPSFGPEVENMEDMAGFFSEIDREDYWLAWEPRGSWEENLERIQEVCEKYDLVHCSDPFKLEPVRSPDYSYSRLHGKPPGNEMYNYTFTEKDLDRLNEKIEGIEAGENYVFWNNYNMYRDLKKYEEITAE